MDENLKRIQKDVDEMNKTFSGEEITTDPPVPETDAPIDLVDEVKTEPPSTDEPEEFKTDAPETSAPKTDAPTTDAPDDRDQIISDLRAKLADKGEAPKTQAPTTTAPLTFEDQDFVGDLDIEDSSDLNKILNAVYQKGITDTRGIVGKQATSIPNIVTMVSNLQKATETFYNENKDLVPFKKVVATVFEDLVAENPNKPYSDLMKDVAPEARNRLELPPIQKKTVDKGKPPKLPRKKGKSGKTKDKPTLDPMQADIDEMNKDLRR